MPDNGYEWRKFHIVPLAPLASPCSILVLCLMGVETDGQKTTRGGRGSFLLCGGTIALSYSVSDKKKVKNKCECHTKFIENILLSRELRGHKNPSKFQQTTLKEFFLQSRDGLKTLLARIPFLSSFLSWLVTRARDSDSRPYCQPADADLLCVLLLARLAVHCAWLSWPTFRTLC